MEPRLYYCQTDAAVTSHVKTFISYPSLAVIPSKRCSVLAVQSSDILTLAEDCCSDSPTQTAICHRL